MTETEMTTEMGAAVKELAEKRKHLTCLQAKAERMIRSLRTGIGRVENASTNDQGQYLTEMSSDGWPSFDTLKSIIDDLNTTHARIKQLQDRLRQWGAID